MKHKILLFISCCLAASASIAQATFLTYGKIEFEKKTNQHSVFDSETENTWVEEFKKIYPKMITDHYELSFSNTKSIYKLARENRDNKYMNGQKPSETDVVIQDLQSGMVSIQRDVFEQTYLIQDSTRQLEWRITDETRTIAGFECKKAVTRICDSVYVVAFYTDQILVSSGPESFGGLPGMILGLAVPRLSVTYFATKVELIEPTPAYLSPKQKGKRATWAQLGADLNKAMKDWGTGGARNTWLFSL